jgi:hypothetical protein
MAPGHGQVALGRRKSNDSGPPRAALPFSSQAPLGHGLASPPGHGNAQWLGTPSNWERHSIKCERSVNGNAIPLNWKAIQCSLKIMCGLFFRKSPFSRICRTKFSKTTPWAPSRKVRTDADSTVTNHITRSPSIIKPLKRSTPGPTWPCHHPELKRHRLELLPPIEVATISTSTKQIARDIG